MRSVNSAVIVGNLVRDPDLRATSRGDYVLSFTVAVDDSRPNGQGGWDDCASYIDCCLYGNRAESIEPYMGKGTKVAVQGKLNQHRWQGKDGNPRSNVEIVVKELNLLGRKERREDADMYSEDVPF